MACVRVPATISHIVGHQVEVIDILIQKWEVHRLMFLRVDTHSDTEVISASWHRKLEILDKSGEIILVVASLVNPTAIRVIWHTGVLEINVEPIKHTRV